MPATQTQIHTTYLDILAKKEKKKSTLSQVKENTMVVSSGRVPYPAIRAILFGDDALKGDKALAAVKLAITTGRHEKSDPNAKELLKIIG